MSFLQLLLAEIRSFFKDKEAVLLLFGGALIYPFFYPQPYVNQVVSEVPFGIVDLDNTQLSRDIAYMADATPDLKIVNAYNSTQEAKEAVARNEIQGFLVLPYNFEKDVYLQKRPAIALAGNNTDFIFFGAIVEGSVSSILTKSADVRIVESIAEHEAPLAAVQTLEPFDIELINLFNPDSSYSLYVLPPVLTYVAEIIAFLSLTVFFAGFNERSAKGEHGYWLTEPIINILSARLLCFGVPLMLIAIYFFGPIFELYNLHRLATPSEVLALLFPYIIGIILFSNILGLLYKEREFVIPTMVFLSFPLIFTSVFVWPIQAVPELLVYLSFIFPSTPMLVASLEVNQMGATFNSVMPQFAIAWLQVVMYFLLSVYLMRRQRQKLLH